VLAGLVEQLTRRAADDIGGAVRQFVAAAGSPALHPAGRARGGLRFHHVMEACRRSPAIGDAYRRIVLAGRDRLVALLEHDQRERPLRAVAAPALADVLVVSALGVA